MEPPLQRPESRALAEQLLAERPRDGRFGHDAREPGRMVSIRSVKVTIEVDTNKATHTKVVTWEGDEDEEEFLDRVADVARGLIDTGAQ